jgi:hypothetical protein
LSRILRTLAPKGWPLAPLRDYLVGDVSAMLLSHYEKEFKGKNEFNPPTLRSLTPLTGEEQHAALVEFANTVEYPLRPEHADEIETAQLSGQHHLANRLGNKYASRATSDAMRDLLRTLDTPFTPSEQLALDDHRGADVDHSLKQT